jgi:hypothetical protein
MTIPALGRDDSDNDEHGKDFKDRADHFRPDARKVPEEGESYHYG